jgi:hypothetical protein
MHVLMVGTRVLLVTGVLCCPTSDYLLESGHVTPPRSTSYNRITSPHSPSPSRYHRGTSPAPTWIAVLVACYTACRDPRLRSLARCEWGAVRRACEWLAFPRWRVRRRRGRESNRVGSWWRVDRCTRCFRGGDFESEIAFACSGIGYAPLSAQAELEM